MAVVADLPEIIPPDRTSIQIWHWRVAARHAPYIKIGAMLPFLGLAGWLLQNFLQLRGVVNLLASRIDLAFLALSVFGAACVLTIGIPQKRRWRIGIGLALIITAIAVDWMTPKPLVIRMPRDEPPISAGSPSSVKPPPPAASTAESNPVIETHSTTDKLKVEVHRPIQDKVTATVKRAPTKQNDPVLYIRKTEPFFTYVLFNPYDPAFPFVCANSMNGYRIGVCMSIRDECKQDFHGDATSIKSICGAAIAHCMVALLESDEDSGSSTEEPDHRIFVREPGNVINTPNPHQYQLGKLLSDKDKKLIPASWLNSTITLPIDTEISLIHTLAGNAPESFVTRLEGKNCYRLDLKVTPQTIFQQGYLPEGYQIGTIPDVTSQLVAYSFFVQGTYVIHRDAPPYCEREDYERWALDTFTAIKKNVEN
jgi:hypothetical protein